MYLFYNTELSEKFQDIPNHRSMHETPVKRSAGFIFTILFIIALGISSFNGKITLNDFLFLAPAILFLTVLGFIDDLYHLNSLLKLILELLFIGTMLYIFPKRIEINLQIPIYISLVIILFYTIFTLNLCNFMDGMDLYLAGSFLIFLINLYMISEPESKSKYIILLYILSIGGYFYYNFPNAKMFMGDSGSLPIGFIIAVTPFFLNEFDKGNIFITPFLIPMFWIDGIYTLITRSIKKENVFKAHKDHLYQRIQNKLLTKNQTIILFLSLNLLPAPFYFYGNKNHLSYPFLFSIIFCLEFLIYVGLNKLTLDKEE
jgi:UDP-N-acetylmuramyl pentapeptide phosphotransferase/UDP-N-acetylglucosamine-1-phosphate transferase